MHNREKGQWQKKARVIVTVQRKGWEINCSKLDFRFKISALKKSIFTEHKNANKLRFKLLKFAFINWVEGVKNINSKYFYDCCVKGARKQRFYRLAKISFWVLNRMQFICVSGGKFVIYTWAKVERWKI